MSEQKYIFTHDQLLEELQVFASRLIGAATSMQPAYSSEMFGRDAYGEKPFEKSAKIWMHDRMAKLPGVLTVSKEGKKTVYYAHSMHIYNTNQEQRDIKHLEELDLEVINPNTEEHKVRVEEIKKSVGKGGDPGELIMQYFAKVVQQCDMLAFRGLFDGSIPMGVAKEVWTALEVGKTIIELPHLLEKRVISISDTRHILGYNGQR